MPEERLPAAVEAAAYYIIAEAMTNVAKYAGASPFTSPSTRWMMASAVEVTDDGVGRRRTPPRVRG